MKRKLAKHAEVYALAGSIASIPIALIFEQLLISIAPFSIALTLNTVNRREFESTLIKKNLLHEQNIERIENKTVQVEDLFARQDETHVLIEKNIGKILSLENTCRETTERLSIQLDEQKEYRNALRVQGSRLPIIESKIEEIDNLNLEDSINNLSHFKTSIQEISAEIERQNQQLDQLHHANNENENQTIELSSLYKETIIRLENISEKINPIIQKAEAINIDKINEDKLAQSTQIEELKNNIKSHIISVEQRLDETNDGLLDLLGDLAENVKQHRELILPHLSYIEVLQRENIAEHVKGYGQKIHQIEKNIYTADEIPKLESWPEIFTDEIKRIKPYKYEIIIDRNGSRDRLKTALNKAENKLILVNPWITSRALKKDIERLIRKFLETTDGTIHIGWGYWRDIVDRQGDRDRYDDIGFYPKGISRKEFLERAQERGRSWAYSGLQDLASLEDKYPKRFKLKLIATHEKYFICDRKFALVGSHNFLCSTEDYDGEKEIGIETNDPVIINLLINRYNNSTNWEKKESEKSQNHGSMKGRIISLHRKNNEIN